MKYFFSILFCSMMAVAAGAQNIHQPDSTKKIQVVEASCGKCQFGMKDDDCELAVRINGKTYHVKGTSIDEHGDAHTAAGFCNAISKAEVQGEIKDNVFVATYFKVLKQPAKKKIRKA